MISIRAMEPRDRAFVVSTWAMSLRDSDHAGMIALVDWHRVMRPQINRVIDRPGVRTLVAFETTDPDPIADLYGFLAADPGATPPVVFYAYTKQPFRKVGVQRRLFAAMRIDPALPFQYVCKTPVVGELYAARKIPCAKFEPSIGRTTKEQRKDDRP